MADTENPVQRLTVAVGNADVAKNIFVEIDGTVPEAGKHALGPTLHAAKKNTRVAVTTLGVAIATAAGAVVKGKGLKVTAAGKVETHTANTTLVARALDAAAADGDEIRVFLIPN